MSIQGSSCSSGDGGDDVADILAIAKFNKPLTLGSAFLITLNWSHMRGAHLLVGRNQDSQEQFLTAGAVGPSPRPGADRAADARCQTAVVASLLITRANTEGLGAEPCLLPLKRCRKRASAGRGPAGLRRQPCPCAPRSVPVALAGRGAGRGEVPRGRARLDASTPCARTLFPFVSARVHASSRLSPGACTPFLSAVSPRVRPGRPSERHAPRL